MAALVGAGLIPDDSASTLSILVQCGMLIVPLQARVTARSRSTVRVPVLVRDQHTARLSAHTQVQYCGMGLARRKSGVAPDPIIWRPQAEFTVRRTCEGQLIPGTVPDGIWHQMLPQGSERRWIIEYSSGSYSRSRLRDKIIAYGPNPMLWVTPSAAHARVIETLLDEIYPNLLHTRVMVINWTGVTG
ncbi:hypothetical protein L1280_001948 [Deinococcus sp. HSC-46F16]|uniref:hypothetical protein n=1 Tax=Deinococcus sp. HSC-46F16 TaxID=2910968 RepID=UPI0020A0E091|nr:hypothetical protein [Deinococcus sp. HSC-46F16]MCP2014796.1 hypothetical protein [Deinococcus sp. HSC-46F16]